MGCLRTSTVSRLDVGVIFALLTVGRLRSMAVVEVGSMWHYHALLAVGLSRTGSICHRGARCRCALLAVSWLRRMRVLVVVDLRTGVGALVRLPTIGSLTLDAGNGSGSLTGVSACSIEIKLLAAGVLSFYSLLLALVASTLNGTLGRNSISVCAGNVRVNVAADAHLCFHCMLLSRFNGCQTFSFACLSLSRFGSCQTFSFACFLGLFLGQLGLLVVNLKSEEVLARSIMEGKGSGIEQNEPLLVSRGLPPVGQVHLLKMLLATPPL